MKENKLLIPREIEPDDAYLCCVSEHEYHEKLREYSQFWQNKYGKLTDVTGLTMNHRIEIAQDIKFGDFIKTSMYMKMLLKAKMEDWPDNLCKRANKAFSITVQAFLDGYNLKLIDVMACTKQNTDYGNNFIKYFQSAVQK